MWISVSIVLFIAAVLLTVYLIRLKKQLRDITAELKRTRDRSYDRQLSVSLFDKDLNELAAELNNGLSYQKKLKHDAERAEQSLRQSVSDIAHDLRTPLSVIKGDLQLLNERGLPDEESRGFVRVCMERTETLRAMTDEFFELSVLESDRGKAELKKVNLTNLLMQFIADNEGLIELSGLTPEINFSPRTIFAYANEELLMRILGNLLGNVIKYSKRRFSVTLSQEGGCRVTFTNPLDGAEIQDPGKLFERTYRGDPSRKGSGAGLGLYIVKLLAEKQDALVSASIRDGELSLTLTLRAAD
ncbi:MAG: HAMP domain-containing histidine kinase [Ruminococcus sp.]|nr:HAMP domain-containing histidine kinase [Ruminococcus sp.]